MTMIVESSKMIDERAIYQSEGLIINHVKEDIAREIGVFLLKEGYIKFETREKEAIKAKITGYLGVSTHHEVAALKRQLEKARFEAVEEAYNKLWDKVHKWGSFYGDVTIQKNMVLNFMGDVLKEIKNNDNA